MKNLGQKLRQIRKEYGLPLNTVAQKLNISSSNLSELERGLKDNPSLKLLKKLAAYYKVPIEYFFEKETDVCKASNYEISDSIADDKISETNNFFSPSDVIKIADEFYGNIITNIDKSTSIDPYFISGVLKNSKNKFCLLLNEKIITFKCLHNNDAIIGMLSDILGNPTACVELLEGFIENIYPVYLYCWSTPLCSKAEAFLKLASLINSNLTLQSQVYDHEIKKMFK